MKNEPIIHDVAHPVTASKDPGNAYYLRHCAVVERGPSYAACLSRLHDIDKGIDNERTNQCQQAVKQGRCVAHGMREQEELAGVAMFYFPRLNKPFLPVETAGDFGVLITNLTDPALIPKEVKPFGHKPGLPARSAGVVSVKKVDKELEVDALQVAINNAANAALGTGVTVDQVKEVIEALPPELIPELPPKAPTQSNAEVYQAVAAGGFKPGQATVIVGGEPPVTAPKIQPGETPLQFARRMAALRNAK